MSRARSSLKPIEGARRSLRSRLSLKGELQLAAAPTVTVLAVLAFVEVLSRQRLLFAFLASSAFLIYLDPNHGTNSPRTLLLSQSMAATTGWLAFMILGTVYFSEAVPMVVTIVLMIVLDAVHPPAVSTSLSFAFKTGNENNLVLFGSATPPFLISMARDISGLVRPINDTEGAILLCQPIKINFEKARPTLRLMARLKREYETEYSRGKEMCKSPAWVKINGYYRVSDKYAKG
jgi:hypothetical protein